MKPDDYLANRVDDQIDWYDLKSQKAQRWFKRIRTTEIIAASAIPLFAGFGGGSSWSTMAVGVLGALVAILAAILSLNQYQENWIQYRSTCESLKNEKFLYLTGTKPYQQQEPFDLFVQRIEELLTKENSAWSQYTTSGADASNPGSNSEQ